MSIGAEATGDDMPEVRQLDPGQPIARQLLDILRERIIRCDLKPGDRLSESEVARGYAVSRQPVREAFIRLSDEKLVAVLPQRGTIVSRIGYSAVLDARFVREAIEADIAKILAERQAASPDAALIAELRAQVAAQSAAPAARFMALDDLFHRTLAEAAGTGGAWRQIEGLKAQMDRVRFLSIGHFPLPRLIAQHSALVEQIAAGSVSGANAAIRAHLRAVLTDLPRIAAENTAYFELPVGGVPHPVSAPIQGGETP